MIRYDIIDMIQSTWYGKNLLRASKIISNQKACFRLKIKYLWHLLVDSLNLNVNTLGHMLNCSLHWLNIIENCSEISKHSQNCFSVNYFMQ